MTPDNPSASHTPSAKCFEGACGWWMIVALVALAGFVTKFPTWLAMVMNESIPTTWSALLSSWYDANFPFFVSPFLVIFFCIRNRLSWVQSGIVLGLVIGSAIYSNSILAVGPKSDTHVLAVIHMPLFLWFVLGATFIRFRFRELDSRLAFLRYTGEMLILSIVILLSGMLLTGLILGIVNTLELPRGAENSFRDWYFKWVVVYGIVGAPIVATHALSVNPTALRKVCPLLAGIFSPLLLVTVLTCLVFMFYSGQYVSIGRNTLLFYNLLLISLMAIVIFSFIEVNNTLQRWTIISTGLLVWSTLVLDVIVLWGIGLRTLDEWGLTPNRIVVLGSNLLIFVHLVWILIGIVQIIRLHEPIRTLHSKLVGYFPIYGAWSAFVVFLLPIIYG